MHSTLSGGGHRFKHLGHWAFSDQAVGISTVGASSSSTWPVDVSMATQTAARLVSTLTLPDGKTTRETLDKEEECPCFTLASGQMVWAAFSVTVTQCRFY